MTIVAVRSHAPATAAEPALGAGEDGLRFAVGRVPAGPGPARGRQLAAWG
jgi:hypothetical protein